MKFGTELHGSQTMYLNDIGGSPTQLRENRETVAFDKLRCQN